MEKLVLADTAGFCFGVKRAVDAVYDEIKKGDKVYTYGPIIHNDEVIKDLTDKGVHLIKTEEELKTLGEGTIIIRSHGVPEKIYDIIKSNNLNLVDATCPFVLKIHKTVKEQTEQGRHIIIVGSKSHPEVQGITGWCLNNYTVLETKEDAETFDLPVDTDICIVAQTTINYNNFQDIVEIISKKGYDIIVINTICNATKERQTEAKTLAKASDAMIVIGDRHSSNTQKLYEISKAECENTYYIQTLKDLDLNILKSFRSVGITAGASTPNNIIKEVHTACQK
ncbi:4-hydroxy-3-methylbut-2-enyl diphosphate reductase [Anaerocolumna chitinilytica]|uniref:4-hydroxy-3-methylbut-2-enyl diphosphate reductase n=1 Tax=Anaerocolumna chitinilytica TaxID=1727145 RepID=A0A7I8DN28_9FIRM|nr:4-hydroxy-3-methylbut-2-enyl diphosphate reductase [Anaerocolumna chitinilytica]BCJ99818.1 4-hydroxy-3-methylbut-2-enyl diphosphate reductase [Anaerocolumna chitinilytica]